MVRGDQVAPIGGAPDKGAWWEAPGGGQGRGGKWRKPGTAGFLKNHRNMLTYMAQQGALQLEEAESAFQQARRDLEQAPTQNNITRLGKAADQVRNRSQNVVEIARKLRRLDEDHVYILTDDSQVVPLTNRRNSWFLFFINRDGPRSLPRSQANQLPA